MVNNFFTPIDGNLCGYAVSVENFFFHYKDDKWMFLGHNFNIFYFGMSEGFCIFAPEMKRATNIFFSVIMLTMILLGTSGVSLEKCSCTGKISLALPTDGTCCPDEGSCMTVKSMQLSDYVPTMTASLDLPVLPVLFAVIPPTAPVALSGHSTLCPYNRCSETPPGGLAQTVAVMRV
jgi:hypothetical protein